MRADRLLAILLLLQTKGRTTAKELSRRLEVSERTIYRDLDALSAAGVPVYAERGPGGGCALLEGYQTRLTGLTEVEIQALSMFRAPAPLADLGISKDLERALIKLSAALPSVQRRSAEEVRERVHLDTAMWFRPKEPTPHLGTLQGALWQNRKLRLRYGRAGGRVAERLFEPLGLVAKVGIWYLVGRRVVDGVAEMRVYRVSRVLEATLTDETFERPEGFDLAEYWRAWCEAFEGSRTLTRVEVRVAPGADGALGEVLGEWVHRELAGVAPDRAGWRPLTLTFEMRPQALGALMVLGPHVEVVEPRDLRNELLARAAQLTAHYGARAAQLGR